MATDRGSSIATTSEAATSGTPLIPEQVQAGGGVAQGRWKRHILYLSSLTFLVSVLLGMFIIYGGSESGAAAVNEKQQHKTFATFESPEIITPPPTDGGADDDDSLLQEKTVAAAESSYPWTEEMLSWQRTAFHFQPESNWMNDPNGPLFHMGWYHLFYQYNPNSAIWGNITWGHAVSRDMIHWLHLPISMEPDRWFDLNGVWTGSATTLPDGQIYILYTGITNESTQVQNLAYPANLSDPLLLEWIKYPASPVMVHPPGIGPEDFRDPSTAWLGPDGKWRVAIASMVNTTGVSFVYETADFKSFDLSDGFLHEVSDTGMWECVDFFPISTVNSNGLDTSSASGPGVKHVLKAGLFDLFLDFYALGTYDIYKNKWTPDNPELDIGSGLRLDYGRFYASKSFFDQHKQRRIMWGWIPESDSQADDLRKGWASVQSIPRTVVFDKKTGTNIIQWPIEEVESLRLDSAEFNDVKLPPGSIVPLEIGSATQLDIVASFELDGTVSDQFIEGGTGGAVYNCTSSGGGASRGALGPFGLVVVADESLTELTPVYFYIAKGLHGKAETYFCSDQSRSSIATSVEKKVYGSKVPVLDEEKYTMRILVDHSIVESFGQGGRTVITSRVYPTMAIDDGASRLFVFNNATGVSVKASVKAWHMDSAHIHTLPLS